MTTYICQLSLIEPWACRNLIVSFVSSESANLQLKEINFWKIIIGLTRILLGILAPALLLLLGPRALYDLLMVVVDIYMTCLNITYARAFYRLDCLVLNIYHV